MKNKKFLSLSIAAATLLSLGTSVVAFADEENPEPVTPVTPVTTSNATVTFVMGDEPTPPVEPENPDEVMEPGPGEGGNVITGNRGPLRLDLLPTFNFGEVTVTPGLFGGTAPFSVDVVSNTRADGSEIPHFVQLTDARGTGTGWSLSARKTQQFTAQLSEDNTVILAGATIDLSNKVARATYGATAATATENAVTLVLDESRQLAATSAFGQGMGINTLHFGSQEEDTHEESVTLNIQPGTQVFVATYTAVINWELSPLAHEAEVIE